MSVWPFDAPPPGGGVNTVIVLVRTTAWSRAVIVMVSWFADTNFVARSEPSTRTTEQWVKLAPFTLSVTSVSPIERVFGSIDVVADEYGHVVQRVAVQLPPSVSPGIVMLPVSVLPLRVATNGTAESRNCPAVFMSLCEKLTLKDTFGSERELLAVG